MANVMFILGNITADTVRAASALVTFPQQAFLIGVETGMIDTQPSRQAAEMLGLSETGYLGELFPSQGQGKR